MSTDFSMGLPLECTSRMAVLPRMSGLSSVTRRSNLPGRSSAGSSMSGRLVAATTMTEELVSKPSISTSIWLSVCSRSSCPPPSPAPRCLPTASISSTKMMHGACRFACWNRSRTRDAPTPTNISTNSEPEMEKNGTPASPATARASSVLPVPGGPTNSTPRGMRAPRAWNRSGNLRNSTISSSSSLASGTPATSKNVTVALAPTNMRARVRPKFIVWLLPDCACRSMKMSNPAKRMSGRNPSSAWKMVARPDCPRTSSVKLVSGASASASAS